MHPQFLIFRDLAGSNDQAAQERCLPARFDCENLMLVSSWVEHGLGDRSRLGEKLREYLADKPLPCNPLHDLLARVAQQKPLAIITTNYDDLIEQALLKKKFHSICLSWRSIAPPPRDVLRAHYSSGLRGKTNLSL